MKKKKTNTDHITWNGSHKFSCKHCNETYQVTFPSPLGIVHAVSKEFLKMHKYCKKRKENETGHKNDEELEKCQEPEKETKE